MEYRKPHEIANQLHEARLELRAMANLPLETTLMKRIAELPEDDFCNFARESMQMGAGFAQLQRDEGNISSDDIFAMFFATQPQNRYVDYETVSLQRRSVIQIATELLESGNLPECDSYMDTYEVEAAAAFAEGFMIAFSFVPFQHHETEVA